MTFHNVRLSEEVERGARGGPRFHTTIITLSSGYEKRNIDWERARGEWDIGYGVDKKSTLEEVLAFFYAREGRAHTFRFKDWTDYEVGVDSTDTPQEIALGDNSQDKFQAVRRYSSGSIDYDRPITRLVSGTIRVFLDAVEQTVSVDYTVDEDTGVIDFSTPPGSSVSVGLICEFDVPVRFAIDNLDLTAFRDEVYSVPEITILEIKEVLQSLA